MGSFLFTAVSFVVALGVLITVHEFGHFWVARRLGVKVLRFSIGFGKPLLRWSGKDDTEYVVAALPLGGYVKMLDEREEPVPEPELPHAFNRQSLPVRSAIVVAGPLFNFLFAIFAYWAIFVGGDTGLKPLVGEVAPQSIAAEAGFKPSDEILDIDGKETPAWESVIYALLEESLGDKDLQVRVRDAEGVEDTRILPGTALRGLTEDGQLLENLELT
ncbi:MAG TPA: RIP metalloprotease RseP, partial [Chromatiales bacterium]|nr:RIP metalloprotease RseP [Chromatiales bacterium]